MVNWALADQGMVSGANVLTGVVLARFLGAEGFGTYTLAWAVLLFVASIHLALVVGSMMAVGPKQEEEEEAAYYGAVIVQNLAFSIVGTLVVFGGAKLSHLAFPSWEIGGSALPIAAATFATTWQEFMRRYFFTRNRAGMAFAVDTVRYGGQIVVLLLLFVGFPGMIDSDDALWAVAGAAAIPAALSFLVLGAVEYRRETMVPVAVRHYESAKWMVVSSPLEWAGEYVFIFATGSVINTAAVGALRASQNIAALTSLLFLSLLNVVPARAAHHLHRSGRAAMDRYLLRTTVFGAGVTGAVCLVIALFPEFFLGLLFGDEFRGYGEIVRWWALVYTVNFFVLPLRSGLRALEITLPVFVARVAHAAFAAAFAVPLISLMGLSGAPIGVLGAKVILVALMWWPFAQSRRAESR
jgi:O-antigen/teichoic acid export membrane protein